MTTVTLKQLCGAVADTMRQVSELREVQDLDELKEGMNTQRVAQVYPVSWNQDASNAIHQKTFGGRTRLQETVINVDVYGRARAEIGEDIDLAITLADAVNLKLETLAQPYFGLADIKAYAWRGERIQFEYAEQLYVGIRYVITLTTF